MKYCPECGFRIYPKEKFCPECGKSTIPKESQWEKEKEQFKKDIKKPPFTIAIGILIGVILVGAVVAIAINQMKSNESESGTNSTLRVNIKNVNFNDQNVAIYLNSEYAENVHVPSGASWVQIFEVSSGTWTVRAVPSVGDYDEKTIYAIQGEVGEVYLEVGG